MRVSHLDGLPCARRPTRAFALAVLTALATLAGLAVAAPAAAQEDLEDVLGEIGTDTAVEGEAPAAPGEGTLSGRVFDGETGAPVRGATVILQYPGAGDEQEVTVTAADGGYEFPSVPPGTYSIQFVKAGYRASTMTDFEVLPDQVNTADFPLPPRPTETTGEVLELEAFVVEASTVSDLMTSLELRLESDELLNIMSAEDLSRFAASDVADALKRVAGVNIVEGQFAIIRGLEDRYSSTTFNGAAVPSPDPDRQSVQLDLFPSEVVDNLAVVKTFAPDLPSNSSGGSIDILTQEYPEAWTISVKAKGGLNENPYDGFLELRDGRNPVGKQIDGIDTLEEEYGGAFGGRQEVFGREVRARGVVNWGTGYVTGEGFTEERESRNRFANNGVGDLAAGALTLTQGRFERTTSEFEEQLTWYGGLGIDLDEEGAHKLDFTFFRTESETEIVQSDRNGHLPGFRYLHPQGPVQKTLVGDDVEPGEFRGFGVPGPVSDDFAINPTNQNAGDAWLVGLTRPTNDRLTTNFGALWFSSFGQSASFATERELTLYQLNGDHTFDFLDDLNVSWAANHATTAQDEESRRFRHWYEPCGWQDGLEAPERSIFNCPNGQARIGVPGAGAVGDSARTSEFFPVSVESLGLGLFATTPVGLVESGNGIDEDQWFGRIDLDYERAVVDWLTLRGDLGFWYESVEREVESNVLGSQQTAFDSSCLDDFRARAGEAFAEFGTIFGDPSFGPGCVSDTGNIGPTLIGFSLEDLGRLAFNDAFQRDAQGLLVGSRTNTNETDREILGLALRSKATVWEKLDLLGGVRVEQIEITSENDPFTGSFEFDGSEGTFPSKWLFFDRFDNPVREGAIDPPPFNDEIIGFPAKEGPCRGDNPAQGVPPPPGPAPGLEDRSCVDLATREEIEPFVNGEIDELKILPSVGLAWRPLSGLTFRGAWSQTVARPSSRELGYYVSFEPGTDDAVVGNPLLQLSEVESFDARLEYVGEAGDLFALSGFFKRIEDPIESVVLRDRVIRTNASEFTSEFRTFFNNPNTARLLGVEVEGRKVIDFVPGAGFLEYLSVGGNFTYIDAEVDRTEGELLRSENFVAEGQTLARSRRLFGQPEWIANADVSFDQPDWGTKITLAFFAISDVLDALGTAIPGPSGNIESFTLDRYIDSFHTLDLVVSQELGWGFALKGSVKNLTDSERREIYDPEATSGKVALRELKFGREYSLQLQFRWTFGGP